MRAKLAAETRGEGRMELRTVEELRTQMSWSLKGTTGEKVKTWMSNLWTINSEIMVRIKGYKINRIFTSFYSVPALSKND